MILQRSATGIVEYDLPGKDLNDVFTDFNSARELVQSHLLELVDYTG